MKQKLAYLFLAIFIIQSAKAQSSFEKNYRNFPIVLTLQFHNLGYPFKDLKSNFKNIGIGIGTEIALGGRHEWAQQFQMSWYSNQQTGGGFLLYTQSAYRPTIVADCYAELKAGFGVTHTYNPVESFVPTNGKWNTVGLKGDWLFTVPVGISLGYNKYSPDTYIAPFVSYQVLMSTNFASGLPVMSNSLIQIGSRIHLKSFNP